MGEILWPIAEAVVFAVDIAGVLWYLYRKMGTGRVPYGKMTASGLLALAVLMAMYFLSTPDIVRIPILAVLAVALGLFLFRGSIAQRVFRALLAFLILYTSDALVVAVISLLPGISFGMVMQPTVYRALAMVTAKIVFLFIIFLSGNWRPQAVPKGAYKVAVIAIPAISIGLLAALVEYERILNAGYGLAVVSLGVFAIMMILLWLHRMLSQNAALLAEKEKLLQLADLQGRCYSETMASTDEMKAFRHDLKNHLQVLSSLLDRGDAKKAQEYLREISIFIHSNDAGVASGDPLVDAVLGSKVAFARRAGIRVDCAANLSPGVAMKALDLCSIIGNVMDNAVEACARIEDKNEEKRIEVLMRSDSGVLNLSVANTSSPAGSAGKSSSKPGEGHGIGLTIVRKTVERYAGSLQISHKDGEFRISIAIPAQQGAPGA